MNDENLQLYLYNQLNTILDSKDDFETKQKRLGQLFFNVSNSISAIYLINNEESAKQMFAQATGQKIDLDFKNLLKHEWYIYTNIEIWLEFIHALYGEIDASHEQYYIFSQVIDTINVIESQLGIDNQQLVS